MPTRLEEIRESLVQEGRLQPAQDEQREPTRMERIRAEMTQGERLRPVPDVPREPTRLERQLVRYEKGLPADLQETGPAFKYTYKRLDQIIGEQTAREQQQYREANPEDTGKRLERGLRNIAEHNRRKLWRRSWTLGWADMSPDEKLTVTRKILRYETGGRLSLPGEREPFAASKRELAQLEEVRQHLAPTEQLRIERMQRRAVRERGTAAERLKEYGYGVGADITGVINIFGLADRFVPGLSEAVQREQVTEPERWAVPIKKALREAGSWPAEMAVIGGLFREISKVSPIAAQMLEKIPGLRRAMPAAKRIVDFAWLQKHTPATAKVLSVALRQGAKGAVAAVPVTAAQVLAEDMTWDEAKKRWLVTTAFLGGISAALGAAGQVDAIRYANRVKAGVLARSNVQRITLQKALNRAIKQYEVKTGKPFVHNVIRDLRVESIGPKGERIPAFMRAGPPPAKAPTDPQARIYHAARRLLWNDFQTAMRTALVDEQIAGIQGALETEIQKRWIPGRPAETPKEMALRIFREGVPPVRVPAEPGRPTVAKVAKAAPAKPRVPVEPTAVQARAAVGPSVLKQAAQVARRAAAAGKPAQEAIRVAAAIIQRAARDKGVAVTPEQAEAMAGRIVATQQRAEISQAEVLPTEVAPTPGSRDDFVAQVVAMREAGETVTPETVAAKLAVGRDVAETLIAETAPAPPGAPVRTAEEPIPGHFWKAPREIGVPFTRVPVELPRNVVLKHLQEDLADSRAELKTAEVFERGAIQEVIRLTRENLARIEAGPDPATVNLYKRPGAPVRAEREKVVPGAIPEEKVAPAPAGEAREAVRGALATPAARQLAERREVDLSEVAGTGADGRITIRDVAKVVRAPLPETEKRKTELRGRIRRLVAVKGLPQTEWRAIAKKYGGYRKLTARKMGVEQLEAVLAAVQKARPHRVGAKRVITRKTERKIQTLKGRLTQEGRMTDEEFARILKDQHIKEPRYVDAKAFITEIQGKDLIKRMLDEAILIERRVVRERALANPHADAPTDVRTVHERLERHIESRQAKRARGGKPVSVSPLWDMRFYAMEWERKTGGRFYEAVQAVLDQQTENEGEVRAMHDRLAKPVSEAGLRQIMKDEVACKRIEDYLASSLVRGGPERPADITLDEVKVAEAIRGEFQRYESVARLARFYDIYYRGADLPKDITKQQWRKALDIYEGQGLGALEEHLKGEHWGIIGKGYTPLSVLTGKIRPYRMGPTAFAKSHIRTRSGLYLPQEKTIFQRLNSYAYQMLGLTRLRPHVNAFVRTFDAHSPLMKEPQKVGDYFGQWLDEVKGYPARKHAMAVATQRLYAQSMAVVVLADPRKWVRNLHQNLAYYPDRLDLINPLNKPLTQADRDYFKREVSQRFGLLQDYFMQAEKPLPGFKLLTKAIRKIGLYPLTDETNRVWCFWAKINRVRQALAQHPNNTEAMMRAGGVLNLDSVQQRAALEMLAKEGPDAMARYVARETTFDVHFAYVRSFRPPVEHGQMGRVLGNLMTFPRSYGQRVYRNVAKLRMSRTYAERYRAMKELVSLIVGAILAGKLYQYITGALVNSYNPLRVFNWTFGGLAVGAIQDGFDTLRDMPLAAMGDERAAARLTTGIPRCADLFVPFYSHMVNALEAATGFENIDRYALRKIRAMVDERYKGPDRRKYEVDRNAIEMLQKIFFGARIEREAKPRRGPPPPPPPPKPPLRPSRPSR